ncbi:(2Fe-2S)-binding protein [Pigmentiphaga soli]|uniref:(2Fe-2S)-binding protein n=1 Tax=Pigmentiphaga soli TaxID=1007095 RepID=A0ABP8H3R8_9BURK
MNLHDAPAGISADLPAEPAFMVEIHTVVNGRPMQCRVRARQHLADMVRDELGLTGTHLGCEHGVCGGCSVLLDGAVVRGCLTLAAQAGGRCVETIEGASERGVLRALQEEFARRNAAQCGFCTPGMLLTAHELLESGVRATRAEIREHISGNFCRCTGYQAIVDAIEAVMARRGDHRSEAR